MNPLLLALAATGTAFLAGLGVGLLACCQKSRQPRAAGPFDLTFECPRWRQSEGECCPDGTVRPDCPALFDMR